MSSLSLSFLSSEKILYANGWLVVVSLQRVAALHERLPYALENGNNTTTTPPGTSSSGSSIKDGKEGEKVVKQH